MKNDYIEIALLRWWHHYLNEELVVSLEEKYKDYKKNGEWELLENSLIKYIEWLNVEGVVDFISQLRDEIYKIKLVEWDDYNWAIISMIFSFMYWGFIYDNFQKYKCSHMIKQYLFSLLDDLESWNNISSYITEKIVFYRHEVYKLYKWLSHNKYHKLFEEEFKNKEWYQWLYKWYWEFLDEDN